MVIQFPRESSPKHAVDSAFNTMIYSYVMTMDFGFAPNPFHGECTLACCASNTRKAARIGDYIVGTSGANYTPSCHLIYAMKVTQIVDFQQYWEEPKYQKKKVVAKGSEMLRHGDNIYHRCSISGDWVQERSRHSNEDGTTDCAHLKTDTGVDKVLISENFVYFGRDAIVIPDNLRNYIFSVGIFGWPEAIDLVALNKNGKGRRQFKRIDDPGFVSEFECWFAQLPKGRLGRPFGWK